MGFFSTAANSPKPGTATANMQNFLINLETLEQKKRVEERKLAAEKRHSALSQSLLKLEDTSKQGLLNWAVSHEVSADELKTLTPILEQRKNKLVWAEEEDDNYTWLKNTETGEIKNKTKKDKKVWVPQENDKMTWLENINTGDRKNEKMKPTRVWVQKEDKTGTWLENSETGDRKNFKAKPVVLQNKEDENFFWQENPVTGDKTDITPKPNKFTNHEDENFIWQEDRHGKIHNRVAKSSITEDDKVEQWYLKLKGELEKAYYGDNMEPSDAQRNNFDRAMLKAETRIVDMARKDGISKEQAYPRVRAEIRKENIMMREVKKELPIASKGTMGYGGSFEDSIMMSRQFSNAGIPLSIVGDALSEKGWSNEEVAEILTSSASIVTAKSAGIDMAKLKKNLPRSGKGVVINGVLWVRQGGFLVSDDGRRVKL